LFIHDSQLRRHEHLMRFLYFSTFLKNKETFNAKSIEHYPLSLPTG